MSPARSPLQQYNWRGRAFWNRRPRQPLDAEAWKSAVLVAEQFAVPTVRTRERMAQSNAGLVEWVRNHRHLAPADKDTGESGMALLILWEVDHGCPFPRHGGDGPSAALLGFTRRLKSRVLADAELCEWLACFSSQRPLGAGLPATHHLRWTVRIVPPPAGEPQGWYDEFVRRWKHYLEGVVFSAAAAPTSSDVASSSRAVAPERTPGVSRQRKPRPCRPASQPARSVPQPPPENVRPAKRQRPAPAVEEVQCFPVPPGVGHSDASPSPLAPVAPERPLGISRLRAPLPRQSSEASVQAVSAPASALVPAAALLPAAPSPASSPGTPSRAACPRFKPPPKVRQRAPKPLQRRPQVDSRVTRDVASSSSTSAVALAASPSPQPVTPGVPPRLRTADPASLPAPKRRQVDLRRWMRPSAHMEEVPLEQDLMAAADRLPVRHGRATEGPPT